jgi:hypothetical protein
MLRLQWLWIKLGEAPSLFLYLLLVDMEARSLPFIRGLREHQLHTLVSVNRVS